MNKSNLVGFIALSLISASATAFADNGGTQRILHDGRGQIDPATSYAPHIACTDKTFAIQKKIEAIIAREPKLSGLLTVSENYQVESHAQGCDLYDRYPNSRNLIGCHFTDSYVCDHVLNLKSDEFELVSMTANNPGNADQCEAMGEMNLYNRLIVSQEFKAKKHLVGGSVCQQSWVEVVRK